VKLLLDTHTLLWWWTNDPQLSTKAKRLIASDTNTVFVSAASAWEIATKNRLGKLEIGSVALQHFHDLAQSDGFTHLPMTWQHAVHAGGLALDHRDPFDRMLAAQSFLEDATLITKDAAFSVFSTRVVW
jgi:PIN domain nuclease of toxin-antitoxin system